MSNNFGSLSIEEDGVRIDVLQGHALGNIEAHIKISLSSGKTVDLEALIEQERGADFGIYDVVKIRIKE